MPLYEYECDACGHRFEHIHQKFSEPPIATCPTCGGHVHKLMSSPAIQFKGSGFYITDYAKKDSGTAATSEAKSDAQSDAKRETKGDAKADAQGGSKGESRSDAKTEAKSAESTSPKGDTSSTSSTPAASPPTPKKGGD